MKRSDVDLFEKYVGQLLGAYEEISLLSKKNPNDAVNKFKLKYINENIKRCNVFLSEKYCPLADFEGFDEDDVPQNSDVVFILSQYLQAFEKMRLDNVVPHRGAWYWRVKAERGEKGDENGNVLVRTAKPKSLKD